MKWKYLYAIIILVASNCMLFAQITKNSKKSASLLPLAKGNYWVYSSSQSPDKTDTIKITQNKIIGSDTAYYFKEKLLLVKNDTIFEFQPQRNGNDVANVQYFRSDTDVDYRILVGGDAWAGRSVKKLKAPYKVNGKEYSDCYEFTDKLFGKTTVMSKGVGIIEMKYPDQTIFLVDYKIK
jgi:hypothetical protein